MAQKFFNNTDPIGKTVKTESDTYTVSGVFKEDFLNHFKADFFASDNSTNVREHIASIHNWVVDPNYYIYIKLKPNTDPQHVINELAVYTKKHAGPDMKATGDKMTNSLQPLKNIHLYSSEYQSYLEAKQGNINYLYLLGSICLAVLLLGCINYMNLSTAQAIDRAREVGVRRVMGAGNASIRYQFLMETIAISLIALIVAIGLSFLFLPAFNSLTGQTLSFFAPENRSLILYMLLIALLTGLLAGLYPAWYLSAFKPVKVLKGKVSDSMSLFNIRKVLVSAQFIISTCLVFATIVIWQQLHYIMNVKPGFDQEQQLLINLNTDQAKNNSTYFISQLANNPNFQTVSGAASPLVSGDMNFYLTGKTVADKHDIFLNLVDENYIKTVGLQLVSGTNFTPQTFTNKDTNQDVEQSDIGSQVILNEEAVKELGLTPYNAPGKYISRFKNGVVHNFEIMGVVKNYHYFSLHSTIGACAILPANPDRFTTVIAKVKINDMPAAIKFATGAWKATNPDAPFSYWFLNDIFSWDYLNDINEQHMISAFATIAILISCLGLLGLITYTVSQKAKEIGIRKVIGASVNNIIFLFYKQYFRLVIIANLIALPLAWYYMDKWLQTFPYRVNISWWMFGISLSIGVVIAFFTIAFKTIIAARANPVESLRSE